MNKISIYQQRKLLWDSGKTISENSDFMALTYKACASMKKRLGLKCVNSPRIRTVKPLWKDGYENHPISPGSRKKN
jgi:hypothetical protein